MSAVFAYVTAASTEEAQAIGRALVLNPGLLILDEPTEGIQPNIVDDITKVIRRLNQEWGLTVLVVEQKLHLINLFKWQELYVKN